jgi:hypothetical protein
MSEREARRINRELTSAEKARLEMYRRQIGEELPDLQERDQLRKDAREEGTLSGELRRAIHASPQSLAEIAVRAGVSPLLLDDFLAGQRTLRSDVLDRLAGVLGYELHRSP